MNQYLRTPGRHTRCTSCPRRRSAAIRHGRWPRPPESFRNWLLRRPSLHRCPAPVVHSLSRRSPGSTVWRPCPWAAVLLVVSSMTARIHAVLQCRLRQGTHVFHRGVVLHDRAGVHDVAAVACDSLQDVAAVLSDLVRCAMTEQHVGYAAAEAESAPQYFVCTGYVRLIEMEHDAPLRQLGERLQVVIPVPLGIKQGLMSVRPQLLHDRFQRWPEDLRRTGAAK